MFINNKIGAMIHADLNRSLISSSTPVAEQVILFLQVIKDTREYKTIYANIPPEALEKHDNAFWKTEGEELYSRIIKVLQRYSPEGYYFGKSSETDSDYGFWYKPGTLLWAEKIIEYDREPDYHELQSYLNSRKDVIYFFRSETELLRDYSQHAHK